MYALATATQLRFDAGKILEKAAREPVVIQKHGIDSVVLIGYSDFKRLESEYWLGKEAAAFESRKIAAGGANE